MKIVNPSLLEAFRRRRVCEWCNRPRPGGLHPHHIFARGMGGGGQLDIRINLVALCHVCHRSHHDGHAPTRWDLLQLVADREGRTAAAIRDQIHALLRQHR